MGYGDEKREITADILGLIEEKTVETTLREDVLKDILECLQEKRVYRESRDCYMHKYTDEEILSILRVFQALLQKVYGRV